MSSAAASPLPMRATTGVWTAVAFRLLLAGPAPDPAAGFRPFVFIHTGDPELGSPDLEGTRKRFALLAQRANRIGAALVVVAGDLTHDGTPEQLEAFAHCLKQFKMPVKLVPGNHDSRHVYRKHFGKSRYVFTLNGCDFVCLDSDSLDSSSDDANWRWLEETLKESRRQNRRHIFVVMHHPIADRPRMSSLLVRYAVRVVLCGHTHTTEELDGKGFVTYVAPGTAKFRDRKGLGYRVFKVYEDRVQQDFLPLEKEVSKVELTK